MVRRSLLSILVLVAVCSAFTASIPNATGHANDSMRMTRTEPRPLAFTPSANSIPATLVSSLRSSGSPPSCECVTQISNFQPPGSSTASPLNGATNTTATVSFTLTYSNIPSGYALDYGIVPATATGFQWLQGAGSVDGSAYYCGPTAHCYFQPSSSSGSNSTNFTITFGPTIATYDLEARVYILNSTYYDVFQAGGHLYTSYKFSVSVIAAPPTPVQGLTIPGMGFTIPFTTLAGAALPVVGVISGYLFKTRRRWTLSSYLSKIESTYKLHADNPTECMAQLEELKHEIIALLSKGKIEDSHFELLDQKIQYYLNQLSGGKRPKSKTRVR